MIVWVVTDEVGYAANIDSARTLADGVQLQLCLGLMEIRFG